MKGAIVVVPVVASAVQEPVAGGMSLSTGEAGASGSGFVVRERDELSGEQSTFMTVEVEGAALRCLHADRTGIEQVEELFSGLR